jgi:hypothetical protein
MGAAVHVIGQWLLTALAAVPGVAAAECRDVMPAPGAQRERDPLLVLGGFTAGGVQAGRSRRGGAARAELAADSLAAPPQASTAGGARIATPTARPPISWADWCQRPPRGVGEDRNITYHGASSPPPRSQRPPHGIGEDRNPNDNVRVHARYQRPSHG